MVNRSAFGGFYKGRRVLVTGHTGFKGAWLSLWLQELGAKITGLSLPAERPSLFRQAQIDRITKSHFVDIQEALRTRKAILASKPEIVFHLAAQPLVRRSYREPGLTFATNVLGTFHVIQAARDAGARTIICATTDKCYDKPESGKAFVEEDPLGGHDPYSASKACAEIVAASFRDSFLGASRTSLSTARAGNVIGGGDWAEDRLIPDCVRAFTKGKPVIVRNPRAIRPWQHVLDPLSGYLWLAARQWDNPKTFSGAWNFAPSMSAHHILGLEQVPRV
jgi:CDP-glucose 4,6-dehydratase